MITKGNVSTFSFYVRAFDTKNNYRNYGEPATQLSLEQAKEEFAKRCAQNPLSVNTMLGVEYSSKNAELNKHGVGAVDLLQCINGHLNLSEDYKLDEVLAHETLISVNAVSILKREADRLQRISDNATAKCAKRISDNIRTACVNTEAAEQLMKSLADEYGIDRVKDIVANELFGNNEIVNPKRFYTSSTSEDERILFLTESGAGRGNNLFIRDLKKPNSPFIQLTTDLDYQYYPIEVIGDQIYIYTNYGAPKNRIMVADINRPKLEDWKELVPESEAVLSNAEVIGGKLFLTYDKDASNHAYVYGLDGKQIQEIQLPSLGSVGFSGNKDDKECFFGFTSFTIPGATYKYDMDQNTYELYRAPKVQFNSDDFVTEQVFFASKDGVKIPMFLTYKKDLKKDGKNPVFLYGYGGFGISLNPGFSATRIPFLENGGIYAQVNLRGGSEYGEDWHVAGTKMQKQNVFDDFISAAEYLIDQKYTNKDKIAIVGGSNGGLLVGACMTQRPDLFRVAIPQVGVMDMLRYHKFTIGWNWASDYGTSEDSKEMFEYLKGYSPLHNLKPGTKYPATLVTTADHDDRVVPAHSFKFAATLQADNDGTNPTLIRIDSKAGHGAGKPMAKVLEEQADIYGFIMYNLGMKPKF